MQRLVESRFVRPIAASINRLPLPYARLPVQVRGHRMFAHSLDRYLALWLWKLALHEATEARLLASLCKPGMCVVDVGANIGFYSLLFARWVGPTGNVCAFEPDPKNFATLQGNLSANRCLNVRAVNSAVGATSAEGHLYLSDVHKGDHRVYQSDGGRKEIPIRIVALDDYFASDQRIDLVKMDIQGAEGMALAGMQRVITSNPDLAMLFEFWPRGLRNAGSSPEGILTDLQEKGFTIEQIDERSGELVELENVDGLVKSLPGDRYTNLLAKHRMVKASI
jgi:FkbM family methyltransferase